MARPILKWAGGKTKLIPQIVEEMKSRPLHRRWTIRNEPPGFKDKRYIEPFVGGAGAFLGLKRHGMIRGNPEVVLADINPVLIATLNALKEEEKITPLVEKLREMEENFKKNPNDTYYNSRVYLNNKIIPDPEANQIETAAHMIFINKTCFNGLWRVNSRGELNTPIGRTPSGRVTILDEKALREFGKAILEAKILHQKWEKTIEEAGDGDLVYVDPPYWPTDGEYVFRDYDAQGGFDTDEQEKVAKLCAEAASRGARIIISNNYSDRIALAYHRAAKKAGVRISQSRRNSNFSQQRRVSLKRTMTKVKGEPRKEVEEILVFMAPQKS